VLVIGSFGDDLPTVETGVLGLKSGRGGSAGGCIPAVLFNLNFDIFGLDLEAVISMGIGPPDVAGRSAFSNDPWPDAEGGD
jgi:hypothetical protein